MIRHAWWVVAWALSAAAGPPRLNPDLNDAERLIVEVNYPDALQALQRARARRSNSHASLIRILELTGVVAASLGQSSVASDAFRELTVLEPAFRLGKIWAPKVQSQFYEAKGWAVEHGTLELSALPPESAQGRVVSLGLRLSDDPLQLRNLVVQVHLVGEAEVLRSPIAAGGEARLPISAAPEVRWWAELLDENEGAVLTLGSSETPRVASASTARVDREEAPGSTPNSATTASAAPRSGPPLRTASYVFGVAGVAVMGGGAALLASSRSIDSQLNGASTNSNGVVVGMTQARAFSLNGQSATENTLGNIALAVGGTALATGVVLWVYGALTDDSPDPRGSALDPASISGIAWGGVQP